MRFKPQTTAPEQCTIAISAGLKDLLRESITNCRQAHQKLLSLRTVSFDVIIGEEGPVIIEANYNWSIEMLYFGISRTINNAEYIYPSYPWIH